MSFRKIDGFFQQRSEATSISENVYILLIVRRVKNLQAELSSSSRGSPRRRIVASRTKAAATTSTSRQRTRSSRTLLRSARSTRLRNRTAYTFTPVPLRHTYIYTHAPRTHFIRTRTSVAANGIPSATSASLRLYSARRCPLELKARSRGFRATRGLATRPFTRGVHH